AGVEALEELPEHVARFQAALEGQGSADLVAVLRQCSQGFGQEARARIIGLVGDPASLNDDDAWAQVEAQGQHVLYVFEARLQVFGGVQAPTQRTVQGRQ